MRLIRLLTLIFLIPISGKGQVNDAGLWLSAKLSSELSKEVELNISPEIRFDENITELNGFFTDIGLEWDVTKTFFTVVTARLGARNEGEWYSFRQRVSLGLGLKKDVGDFDLGYLCRYQASRSGGSGENDADLSSSVRNKFNVKYTGLKKIDLGTSFEFFNSTGGSDTFELTDWRWVGEVQYNFSKRKALSVGYMIQRDLTGRQQETDFVLLAGYKYEFKSGKKDKKTDETPVLPE